MANLTKSLTMPNGQEYEFVGKQWYGVCTTAAATQTKTVSIPGFTSADLVEGVRVTVRFQYAHTGNSQPRLSVNGTATNYIALRASNTGYAENAGQYEWNANSIITFTYSGLAWVIDNSEHATTTYWGKTKLNSSTSSTSTTEAATPSAVKAAYDLANEKYTKPSGGIPASDLASGVIPIVPTTVSSFTNDSGYLTLATLPIWDGSVT